uniref:Uncharacterized protein n=1 Tax=Stomoxys calcitrans TaxID=35570 RepID=A0A1I8QDX8_STOCA
MKQGSCDYKKLAVGRYAFNAMLELQSPLDPAAMIFIAIDYRMPPAITSQSFFKLKTKLCDLLKGIRTVPIVKNVIKDVLKNSNFPTSCPICANVMYNMSNMVVTSEILPEFVPSAGFNLSLNFFNKEALIIDWKLEGSIVKKT